MLEGEDGFAQAHPASSDRQQRCLHRAVEQLNERK
jgi:hypothetical protein